MVDALLPSPRHSAHPHEHTPAERELVIQTLSHHPSANYTRIYTILCQNGYKRSYKGMWGYISKHNLRGTRPKVPYVPKVYGTFNIPAMLGFKWQMDIKYVEGWRISPKAYQYTMIDEATRRTFEMAYADKSTYSTKDFVKAAIKHFGYMPLIIQTDNGPEFTNRLLATIEAHKINLVDEYLNERHITHKLIPPASPTKNCIVERRHREDERRYKGRPMFADLSNLNAYLKNWCAEKDDTFTFALCPKCHKSPNTRHAELLGELGRFARVELRLRRNPKIQELIYAYCEWERIKAQREIPKVKYIYHLPDGVSLAPDIRCALSRL